MGAFFVGGALGLILYRLCQHFLLREATVSPSEWLTLVRNLQEIFTQALQNESGLSQEMKQNLKTLNSNVEMLNPPVPSAKPISNVVTELTNIQDAIEDIKSGVISENRALNLKGSKALSEVGIFSNKQKKNHHLLSKDGYIRIPIDDADSNSQQNSHKRSSLT
jgi:hypothetical protein